MIERIALPSGLVVDAAPVADVVSRGIELVAAYGGSQPAQIITALHVGGLRASKDHEYLSALKASDLVCADGSAVVALCRIAGVQDAERAPTTDVGLEILRGAVRSKGRVTVALVGGRPGLAASAARRLEQLTGCEVLYSTHGFHDDWLEVCAEIARSRTDLTIVGLGSPFESKWAVLHRAYLSGTILTCGGWFGFLVGDERRAPHFAQKTGLEWLWRLAQSPRRLARRYISGFGVTALLALRIAWERRTS